MLDAAALNESCHCIRNVVPAGLPAALFAAEPVFIDAEQAEEVERAVAALHRWMLDRAPERGPAGPVSPGAFMAYDFHLTEEGPRLIEINTNAGGGVLHALAIGAPVDPLLDMFAEEWRSLRGDRPLQRIAIVDEAPESQGLYPEFLLVKERLEARGFEVAITDVRELDPATVDLVYNRSTDFTLEHAPALRKAWEEDRVVLTPSPWHHAVHADKRNLVGVPLPWVPETRVATPELWEDRKRWYFKPATGHGSKGVLRGAKLTRGRWLELMEDGNVLAQREVPPPRRQVLVDGEGEGAPANVQEMRFDLRAYTYDGVIRLLAARVYRGQTTNLSTPGGGLARVIVTGGAAGEACRF